MDGEKSIKGKRRGRKNREKRKERMIGTETAG